MDKLEKASKHKHNRIAETLVCEIKEGVWSGEDRLPPERELAKRFDCTRATLRTGLKLLEKQNVIERRPGSGTYISNRFFTNQTVKNIGVVVMLGDNALEGDPHLSSALPGLHESSVCENCKIQLIKLNKNETFFGHIRKNEISLDNYDGLFFLSYFLNDTEVRKLNKIKKPFVGVAPTITGLEKLSYVYIDNSDGIQLATNHLLKQGRTHPYLFTINQNNENANDEITSVDGFKKTLESFNLPFSEDTILRLSLRNHNDAYQRMTQLIHQKKDIDCVIAHAGRLTYGVCRAILDAGLRIPEDIAVVMYDDYPWASDILNLPLTAINPPYSLQAQRGLELLYRKMTIDENSFTIEVLQSELRIRESCGAKFAREVSSNEQ